MKPLRLVCVALALTLAAGCAERGAPEPKPVDTTPYLRGAGRNVLLVVLDTVRADRIGSYDPSRQLTPALDSIASIGVRFSRCFANSGWTLPSHASMFTGTYPVRHRATQETLALGVDLPTLAERFTAAGYQTFAASGNAVVSEANGLGRGFEDFVETFRPSVRDSLARPDRHFNDLALENFLDAADTDRPWFAFLNYIEAHLPYAPPEPYRSTLVDTLRFDGAAVEHATELRMRDHYAREGGLSEDELVLLGQLYDGEIAALDLYMYRLVQMLSQKGLLTETLLVIVSDHGENLGDHGHLSHVFSLHNSLLHVPMIVVDPLGAHGGEVREDTAQLLDLFPTLLAYAGIDPGDVHSGRDLFAAGAERAGRPAIAEYYYPRQVLSVFTPEELESRSDFFAPFLHRSRSIQAEVGKFEWSSAGRHAYYRIARDAPLGESLLERGSVPRDLRDLAKGLDEFVSRHQGPIPLPEAPPAGWLMPGFEASIEDPELLDRLRSLGYVH